MAEKGFGVKEIDFIGSSPKITSPSNLNLNAVNVAISTNVSIGGTLSVTGNISVGGTLTYEDVTNIDSVGLITARSGVVVGAGKSILVGAGVTISSSTKGDIQISGIATANSFVADGGSVNVDIGALNQGFYLNNGNSTWLGLSWSSSASIYQFRGNSGGNYPLVVNDFSTISLNPSSGACNLNYAGSGKLQTTNTGINVTGAITVNNSALSIDPTNSDIQVVYTVTANGSSAYRFAGNGVVSTADDPDLYLIRGQKYRFINNSGGSHPFQIREASGGTAYSTGVTNNGAASGNIDFAPTFDSPAQLVYQCTSHSGMVGNIYLKDGNGNETNVGVTTFSGLVHLNQLKKTSGTLDYLAATHNFANAAGSTNYFTVNNTDATLTGSTDGVLNLDTTDARGSFIRFKENGTSKCFVGCGEGLSLGDQDDLGLRATDNIIFRAGSSESMRINSSGTLFIGKTSQSSGTAGVELYDDGPNFMTRNGTTVLGLNNDAGTNGDIMRFYFQDVHKGNLNFSSGSFSATTASDYRLKENDTPITDGIARVKQLRPIRFNFKDNPSETLDGFFAHELQEVVPDCVTGEKDGAISERGEGYQCISKEGLVPLLTAALKEAIAKIEVLETEVAALKAK
tara:strand:+ start:369 stop:2249 length:1881 start_codon:yes stop_codon:yes gene_type:complete